MDLVISNVTSVEPDEEEPLLEITKVTVLSDKREITRRVSSREVSTPKYRKVCYVPLCPNSTVATPEKMFITVPVNPVRRKEWLDIVGKTNGKNPKSPMFCCEDHFNLKRDMKNYEEHLRKGRVQMLLYQTVVPHVFLCNDYGHLKRQERVEVLRKLHKERSSKLAHDEEEEEEVDKKRPIRPTARQRSLHAVQAAKKRKVEVVDVNKTVFIEMPAFEYDDQPEYVVVKEDGIDTIVIDDSDEEY